MLLNFGVWQACGTHIFLYIYSPNYSPSFKFDIVTFGCCSSSGFHCVRVRLFYWSLRSTAATFVICFHWSLLLAFSLHLSSSSDFLRYLFTHSSHLSCGLPSFLEPSCFFVSALFGSLSYFIRTMCPSHFIRHRRSQDFGLGGTRSMPPGRCHPVDATRPMPPSLASVVYTFEALAGSWRSASAPAVSRIMGGAQSEKQLQKL